MSGSIILYICFIHLKVNRIIFNDLRNNESLNVKIKNEYEFELKFVWKNWISEFNPSSHFIQKLEQFCVPTVINWILEHIICLSISNRSFIDPNSIMNLMEVVFKCSVDFCKRLIALSINHSTFWMKRKVHFTIFRSIVINFYSIVGNRKNALYSFQSYRDKDYGWRYFY